MKRYAIVGAGHRSSMFFRAVTDTYAQTSELVALCDTNSARMAYWNKRLADAGKAPVSTWPADRFDDMVRDAKPEVVIVCTRDCDHDAYIVRAMELGCDVITEKPMTTDAGKCARVLEAIERTGRKCTVTFNARYGPGDSKVKELLGAGVIGRVISVNYEHLLDIRHGADYFRRWHRDKANSGGLLVHKCTHCFDLVNWWLAARPRRVVASGGTKFYGPQHGEHGQRCRTCHLTDSCRFYFDIAAREEYAGLYLAAESEDGYFRDTCVFGEGITTEDSVSVIVDFDGGQMLSYQLNAFAPYEGNRIVFNGDKGRLEFTEIARTDWLVTTDDPSTKVQQKPAGASIQVFPHHEPAYDVEIPKVAGGHGGADTGIVRDLFGPPCRQDPLGRSADHLDGARSILVGIAANRSMETGGPVRLDELVKLPDAAAAR
ncbi:MAG: putative oxidoreductase YteT [Phycisphaerae bacterium]|nr:putative oxidoreductase YteT [Phycisphaerae bacterium]